MKYLLPLILLCIGCAGSNPPPVIQSPKVDCPSVATVIGTCTDKLMSLSEDDLKAGVTCPANSRLVFPSTFVRSEKLLVMCQCK